MTFCMRAKQNLCRLRRLRAKCLVKWAAVVLCRKKPPTPGVLENSCFQNSWLRSTSDLEKSAMFCRCFQKKLACWSCGQFCVLLVEVLWSLSGQGGVVGGWPGKQLGGWGEGGLLRWLTAPFTTHTGITRLYTHSTALLEIKYISDDAKYISYLTHRETVSNSQL